MIAMTATFDNARKLYVSLARRGILTIGGLSINDFDFDVTVRFFEEEPTVTSVVYKITFIIPGDELDAPPVRKGYLLLRRDFTFSMSFDDPTAWM